MGLVKSLLEIQVVRKTLIISIHILVQSLKGLVHKAVFLLIKTLIILLN